MKRSHSKIDPDKITFHSLQVSDLELLLRWLNSPHVSRWYGSGNYTYHQVFEKYTPRIKGEVPVRSFLIQYENSPIGYIQAYLISDHPEYNAEIGADEHTAGVDLFIGELDFQHHGYGTAALRKFLREIIFSDKSFTSCLVGPEPGNKAAISCYEKVGFKYWKTIQFEGRSPDEYLMQINRDQLKTIPI